MLSWPACTDKPPEPGVEPRPPEPGGHTGQAHCSEWLTPLRHQGRPDRRTNNRHLATAQSALCIASRIRNRYQISCQTRHKTVSVFWYQFSTPISGQCVMGVNLRGAAMAYATCRWVESNVVICLVSAESKHQAVCFHVTSSGTVSISRTLAYACFRIVVFFEFILSPVREIGWISLVIGRSTWTQRCATL